MPTPRVRNFSAVERVWEQLQRALTTNDWPARLAHALGGPPHVDVRYEEVTVAGPTRGRAGEDPVGEASDVARPLRIAFASDFHAGPATRPDLIERACVLLAESAPDVLLLGGDFVSLRARYVDPLATLLGAIPAPFGRYAVLGNHDLWTDVAHVERRLEAAGIELLTNRNVRLPAPFAHIWLCGLDDHGHGHPDARAAMHDATGARVVLMHAPSGVLDLAGERFDVALCGHTHGGQIARGDGRPIVVPAGRLSRTYAGGRYALDDGATLIVSRGVGCSTVPLRVNAPSDIVVCTVHTR